MSHLLSSSISKALGAEKGGGMNTLEKARHQWRKSAQRKNVEGRCFDCRFSCDYDRDFWREKYYCTCQFDDKRVGPSFPLCIHFSPWFDVNMAADAVGTNPGGNIHNSLMSAPVHVGGDVADGKEEV